MKVIHRYPAAILGLTTITAPMGATIASAVPKIGKPGWNIYLKHTSDEGGPTAPIYVASVKTGVPFPEGVIHIATLPGIGMHLLQLGAADVEEYKLVYPEINEADAG